MDKESPHCRSRKVNGTWNKKGVLSPAYLPTASPEFMTLEGMWNIAKQDMLVLKYCPSFEDFKEKISTYLMTKRFNLDMINYLL